MINALQHIGQGVWDADETYRFYKKHFGFKVKINDITMKDEDMARVIGSVETIRTLMAINARGGGALELVEHKSSRIQPYSDERRYGNYGILEVGYGVNEIEEVVSGFRTKGIEIVSSVNEMELLDGRSWRYSYLRDPDGLILQLVEEMDGRQRYNKPEVRGVVHAGIGVSNMVESVRFYRTVLGFDRLLYEFEGNIQAVDLIEGRSLPMKLAILGRSQPGDVKETFLPAGMIKLFEVPGIKGRHIYSGRRWGDIGCMELGLDVTGLEEVVGEIQSKGVEIYLSPVEIDMGSGSKGVIAYIRDPDGTIIELVEIKTVAWLSAVRFKRFAIPLLRLYDRVTG